MSAPRLLVFSLQPHTPTTLRTTNNMSYDDSSNTGGVGVGAGADNSQLRDDSFSSARTTQGSDYQGGSSGGQGGSYESGTEPRTDNDYIPRDDPKDMKDAPSDSGAYTGNDNVDPSDTSSGGGQQGGALDKDGYPEQRHADYNKGSTFGDKLQGVKEVVKGKVTGNSDLVEKGQQRRTGELEKKEQEEADAADPFAQPEDK